MATELTQLLPCSVEAILSWAKGRAYLSPFDASSYNFLRGLRSGATYLSDDAGIDILEVHTEKGGGFIKHRVSADIEFDADPERFSHTPYQVVVFCNFLPNGIKSEPVEFGNINNIVILDGHTSSKVRTTIAMEFMTVWIDRDFIEGWAKAGGNDGPALRDNVRGIKDDKLLDIIRKWQKLVNSSLDGKLVLENYSFVMIITDYLIKHYSNKSFKNDVERDNSNLLKNIDLYLSKNIANKISIDTMAHEINTDTNSIKEILILSYNCTPYEYILQYKVKFAKIMLCKTNLSISQISYDLGFSSQSHFSTVFKKYCNVGPFAFRISGADRQLNPYIKID